jgi:DNA-binding NarL/FixJ family response regulator
MSDPRVVLAVVPDLFFAAKIAATAKASGVPLELLTPARAIERAAAEDVALVLLDLHANGAVVLVRALKDAAPAVPVVGFLSHVEAALGEEARAAGADAAWPRSRFVTRLPELLTRGRAALTPARGEP